MAQLRVAPELLVAQLFNGARPDVEIHGARFDAATNALMFDISGNDIPAEGEVVAICHTEALRVEFQPK